MISLESPEGDRAGEEGAEPKMSSWSSEVVVGGSGNADMVGWEMAPGTSRSISFDYESKDSIVRSKIMVVQKFGVDGNIKVTAS